MNGAPIEIDCLRKQYKNFVAVDDLTLSVRKGSFTGLLGPNGAGKSTTLKILTNLARATSGTAYLNGHDVTTDAKHALEGVGTVVETPEFYSYLTPEQTFRYMGKLYGMNDESISSQTSEILAEMKMSEWGDKKIGTFSKGMRQRVALGLSLLNEPGIIILDEPTSGLDPRGMAEIRTILKDFRKKKGDLTILMSSHMLHEFSDLCDRVAMVNHGRLLVEGDIDSVLGANSARMITVKLIGGADQGTASSIAALPGVSNPQIAGNSVRFGFKGNDEDQMKLLRTMTDMGLKIYDFSQEDALENAYLSMIKETR